MIKNEKIDWRYVQKNADIILADGIMKLSKEPNKKFDEVFCNNFGNYLISYNNQAYYIGEAQDICKRLKQQFKQSTSTFYKNFQKYLNSNKHLINIPIEHFDVQYITTQLGRKELEEFGIVNFPTVLNRFQLEKRSKYNLSSRTGLWEEVQNLRSIILEEGESEIFNTKFKNWSECIGNPNAGIYIVKNEERQLLYIGESSDIAERYSTHSSRTYFSALRRHIATQILNFHLKEKSGRRKYLTATEDSAVTSFLRNCNAIFYNLDFGRYELEEYLIKKHNPLLNRKGNKQE